MRKITPDLIPHKNFHQGQWLLSAKHPGWYYFRQTGKRININNNHFYASVDAPLLELVRFLHRRSIQTTPSCSGHHKSEKIFKKIYSQLLKDKKEIQNGGLRLKNIESGNSTLLRDAAYSLPWSRNTFVSQVMRYQHYGVIGLKVKGRLKQKLLKLYIPGVEVYQKDSIVFIQTCETSPALINKTWKRITREIKRLMR